MRLSLGFAATLFLSALVDAHSNPILNRRATTEVPAEPSNPAPSAPAPPPVPSSPQPEPSNPAPSAPAPPPVPSSPQAEPSNPAPSAPAPPRVTSTPQAEPSYPAPSAPASPRVTSTANASPETPVAPSAPPSTVAPSAPVPTVPTSSTKPTSNSVKPEGPVGSSSSSVRMSSIPSSSTSSKKVTTSSTYSASTTPGSKTTTSSPVPTKSSSVAKGSTTRTSSTIYTSSSVVVTVNGVNSESTTTSVIKASSKTSAKPTTTTTKPTTTTTTPTTTKASPTPTKGAPQPTTSTNSPPPAPTCPPTNTCIQVAPNGQMSYDPSNLGARNGTIVTFLFPFESTSNAISLIENTPNSVTQGSFDNPCVYLTASGGNPAGFDSGLQNGKLFSIRITNDQLPIYFFSKEQKFCGQGMVGTINAPATGDTFDAYLAEAKALGPNQQPIPDTGPVVAGVGAQALGTPYPPGASPALSATCAPTDTCVQVSPNGQINYDPPNFAASNGTVVTFVFPSGSGSHSVTQGGFGNPCVYLTAAGGNSAGFDSGLQNGKLFSIKITNDQQPIYFFSKEEKVCGQGMVGAINPPATGNTYDAYLGAAEALGPSQSPLIDNGPILGGLGAVAQGTPSPIPSPNSSPSHLAPNSFFALLATAFGIAMA